MNTRKKRKTNSTKKAKTEFTKLKNANHRAKLVEVQADENGDPIKGQEGYIKVEEGDGYQGNTTWITYGQLNTSRGNRKLVCVQAKNGDPIKSSEGYIEVKEGDGYQGETTWISKSTFYNNKKSLVLVQADKKNEPIDGLAGYIKVEEGDGYQGKTAWITRSIFKNSKYHKQEVLVQAKNGDPVVGPDGHIKVEEGDGYQGETTWISNAAFDTRKYTKQQAILVQAKNGDPIVGPAGFIKVEKGDSYKGETTWISKSVFNSRRYNKQQVLVQADKNGNPIDGPAGFIKVEKGDGYQGNTTYVGITKFSYNQKIPVQADKNKKPIKGSAGYIKVEEGDGYQGNITYVSSAALGCSKQDNKLVCVQADENDDPIKGQDGFIKIEEGDGYQGNTTWINQNRYRKNRQVRVQSDKNGKPIKGQDGYIKAEENYQGLTTCINYSTFDSARQRAKAKRDTLAKTQKRSSNKKTKATKATKPTRTKTTITAKSDSSSSTSTSTSIKKEQDNASTSWTTDAYIDQLRRELIAVFDNQNVSCFIATRFIIDYAVKLLSGELPPSLDESYKTLSDQTALVAITTDLVRVKKEKGNLKRKREPLHCLGFFSEKGLNKDIQTLTPSIDITNDNPIYSSRTTLQEENFSKMACFKNNLSIQLVKHAEEENAVLIGHVGLMNAQENKPGHVFVFIATKEKVYFVDVDMARDNQPEKIIFTQDELNQHYCFDKKELSKNNALFKENCFYAFHSILSKDLLNDGKEARPMTRSMTRSLGMAK